MMSLLLTVGAMAQINYGKATWTFPATDHEAVTEVPDEIFEDFRAWEAYNGTELAKEKVGVYTTAVRVAAEGNVTATFAFNGGNIRMDISGVDLVNADGTVVYSDYHFGFAGGNLVNNVYTLENVAAGDYTMRLFVAAQKEDITPATNNDSRGTITLAGWLYPEENVFYNIKNVRSNKFVTFKGEGQQFTQESANNGAGSYWYFVEATLDDVEKIDGSWLVEDNIPAGFKPYWVYSAACKKGVENVTNGYMAEVNAEPYPAKIYYLGVHTKDGKTGFVLRPCHEDGSSWNDAEGAGQKVGHYTSDDSGSLWAIEGTCVTEANLISMGETVKTNALAAVTLYENAYYFNPTAALVDAVRTAINAIDCSTKESSLTSVITGTADAEIAKIASCTTAPKAGDRFMMKNRGRSGYLRAYSAGIDVKCSNLANDLDALDLVWTLVASGDDFKLYNERHKVYVGALSTSNNTVMQYTSDVEAAGVYEISQTGVYTLFHAKDQNNQGYMHLSNWGGKEIVRWDNGEPSQWELLEAPIELTTDLEAPICYAIKSGRDGNYYFTLENNKIKLVNNADVVGNDNAKWFFMLDENKNLKIYPYADKENTMGYITVADGDTKLTNDHNAEGYVADTYTLYYNTNKAADNNGKCFAFRPTTGSTFVSNHGGTGNYMGFYNEHNDKGTRIGFERINDVVLDNKIATWEQYLAHEGDKVGQYVIAEDVKTVVNNAIAVVATKASTDTDSKTAVNALNALTFPTINLPGAGKYYRLKNGASGWYATSDLRTGEDSHSTKLHMKEDGTQANTIWYLDSNNAFLSYTQGLYLGDMSSDWSFEAIGSTGNAAAFVQGATIGKFQIKPSSGRSLYGDKVRVDAAPDTNNSGNYEWIIEEVTSLPVTVTSAGYATFFAPVAVTVPSGVTAHTVTINGEWATLSEALTVIPAETGVVLAGEANTYNFAVTTADAFEGENLMAGTIAKTLVTKPDNTECYVLAKPEGAEVAAMYIAVNGEDETTFYNASHKAYLKVEGTNNVSFYGFRFGGEDDETTGVEKVEVATENAVIFDLAGRRVSEITAPGIYIVNGKKVIK